MYKRKRGKVVVILTAAVAVLVGFAVLVSEPDDSSTVKEESDKTSQNSEEQANSVAAGDEIPQGDVYVINEYTTPTIESVLNGEGSNEEKANDLYSHGLTKFATSLSAEAAEYFDAALELDGVSDNLKKSLVYERYRAALLLEDTAAISTFKPQLSEIDASTLESVVKLQRESGDVQ